MAKTEAFRHDRFLVEQLVRPVVNLYQVSPLGPQNEPLGPPIAYVRQKRMAIKEDIRFFADEGETRELFRIKARSMFEVGGRYDVTTPDGERLGVLEKVFGRSLLRSTWRILDAEEQELAVAEESSMPVALLRRVIDVVPYVGGLIPIPYHFSLAANGRALGELRREYAVRDRYRLELEGDSDGLLDRRLAIALAIGLDALQSR